MSETITTEPKPAPAAPEMKISDDKNIVQIGDQKYITEAALRAERATNAELKASIDALQPLMPEFENFLSARDQAKRAHEPRIDAQEKEELDGYAVVRGYYKEDGTTPDAARAKQELDIQERRTARLLDRAVKPLTETVTRDRAENNRQKAKERVFVDGRPVADAKYIEQAMKAVPEEYLADENVSMMVEVMAAGLQSLDERKNGRVERPRREPTFREDGGRFAVDDSGEGQLSAFDRAAAKARGLSEKDYSDRMKKVNDRNFRTEY